MTCNTTLVSKSSGYEFNPPTGFDSEKYEVCVRYEEFGFDGVKYPCSGKPSVIKVCDVIVYVYHDGKAFPVSLGVYGSEAQAQMVLKQLEHDAKA